MTKPKVEPAKKSLSGITLYAISLFNKTTRVEKRLEKLTAELGEVIKSVPSEDMAVYVERTTEKE